MMKIYNQECKLDLNDSVVGGKTCEGGIFSKDPPFMYLEVICMHKHIQRIYPVAKELQRKKNKMTHNFKILHLPAQCVCFANLQLPSREKHKTQSLLPRHMGLIYVVSTDPKR